jgi:hypothetical protein
MQKMNQSPIILSNNMNNQINNCNVPAETLRTRHLPHQSDGLQHVSPTNKKNKGDRNKTESAYKAQ